MFNEFQWQLDFLQRHMSKYENGIENRLGSDVILTILNENKPGIEYLPIYAFEYMSGKMNAWAFYFEFQRGIKDIQRTILSPWPLGE